MTDAERIELGALELRCKAHALNESEIDRLYSLRLRAAGVATWREVLAADPRADRARADADGIPPVVPQATRHDAAAGRACRGGDRVIAERTLWWLAIVSFHFWAYLVFTNALMFRCVAAGMVALAWFLAALVKMIIRLDAAG